MKFRTNKPDCIRRGAGEAAWRPQARAYNAVHAYPEADEATRKAHPTLAPAQARRPTLGWGSCVMPERMGTINYFFAASALGRTVLAWQSVLATG